MEPKALRQKRPILQVEVKLRPHSPRNRPVVLAPVNENLIWVADFQHDARIFLQPLSLLSDSGQRTLLKGLPFPRVERVAVVAREPVAFLLGNRAIVSSRFPDRGVPFPPVASDNNGTVILEKSALLPGRMGRPVHGSSNPF